MQTVSVKSTGLSKCIWLPSSWGVKKGDLLHITANIGGQTLHHTTTAKENSTRYVIIPKWWPCEKNDLIDVKINFAAVQYPEYRQTEDTVEEDGQDEDSSEEGESPSPEDGE